MPGQWHPSAGWDWFTTLFATPPEFFNSTHPAGPIGPHWFTGTAMLGQQQNRDRFASGFSNSGEHWTKRHMPRGVMGYTTQNGKIVQTWVSDGAGGVKIRPPRPWWNSPGPHDISGHVIYIQKPSKGTHFRHIK